MNGRTLILDYLNDESKKRFDDVIKYLDLLDVDYEINPNIVRGLDYYNHTVFEFCSEVPELGNANTIGAGGRYNNLVSDLGGPETPGIGWAFGLDRIIAVMDTLEIEPRTNDGVDVFVMYINEEEKLHAISLVQDLRMSGLICETENSGRGLKAQFKQADRLNAKYLVILNSEDLKLGLVNIKDNVTKEEIKIGEDEVLEYLLSNN